jgi:acyl dehydratase
MAKEQSLLTPDIKALIGSDLTGDPDYIERNDIRYFAEAIRLPEPPKPVYHNEIYARDTRYGGMIAPPTFFTRLARRNGFPWAMALPQWLQDRTAVGEAAEIEAFHPLRPGDIIFTRGKVANIYEQSGREGRLIYLVRDFEFTNQLGQYVGKIRRTLVKFPETLPYDRPDQEAIAALKECKASEKSPIKSYSQKLTLMQLNQFAGANREFGSYHMDREFAQSLKLPDVLMIETLKTAYVANMLEDHFGENMFITKIATFFPVMDYVGDTLTGYGRVRGTDKRDGQVYVDVDIWMENQKGGIGTVGSATVVLPMDAH